MRIPRILNTTIKSKMYKGKAIILIGARQVGKSTLLHNIVDTDKRSASLRLNCDDPEVVQMLTSPSSVDIKSLIGGYDIIFIDEAQRVPDIGITLKRMIESYPDKQLLVSGSSSFELQNRLNEPLTGRKYEYYLYPISTKEICDMPKGVLLEKQYLDTRLIYGSYPEIIDKPAEAKDLLISLCGSYLYKDILQLDDIRKPVLLDKLLRALALQVGSEVSFNEIAQLTGSNPKTVEKYIDMLEKCFVLFQLPALSRNMRNELKKSKKIYFWDNGIRNAVIRNFSHLDSRTDRGALWENFFVSERIKYNAYRNAACSYYFWRTTDRQEIDLIEECDGRFNIFEMKSSPNAKASIPKSFLDNYDVGLQAIVTPDNYRDYLI